MSSLTQLPDWRKAAHDLWAGLGLGAPPNNEAPWFLTIDDIEIEIRPTSDERQLVLVARIMYWDATTGSPIRLAEQVLHRNYAALIVVPFRVRLREDRAGRPVLAVEALYDFSEPGANPINLVGALVDHATTYRNIYASSSRAQSRRTLPRSDTNAIDQQMIFKP